MPRDILEALHLIVDAVNAAEDLQSALEVIVTRVRQAMSVDVCSVYLLDSAAGEHVLMATQGLRKDAVGRVRLARGEGLVGWVAEHAEPINLEDGASHPRYRFVADTAEERYHGFLGVPIIQYREVLGVLVVRQRQHRRFEEQDVTFLFTLAAQLAGAILHAKLSGEMGRLLAGKEAIPESEPPRVLRGQPGAPGIVIAPALVAIPKAKLSAVPDRNVDDVVAEQARFRAAVEAVKAELRVLSERLFEAVPAEDLALFDAYQLMLGADSLVDQTLARINAGSWAPAALRDTIHEHVRVFEAMEDSYLRERASDVRDLGRRLLLYLQQDTPANHRVVSEKVVLIGEEIGPSELSDVAREQLAGVVTTGGSSNSHVAILARALGIPAVMGIEDLPTNRLDGEELIVDGFQGRVFVRPNSSLRNEFLRLARQERALTRQLLAMAALPAQTLDGHRLQLYVNTGLTADIEGALGSGADGVGLYRTEIPFLARNAFPSEEEQARIYRVMLERFAPRPVVLRVLDIGGDKPLPYFPVREDNPFLGWRGIRLLLDHPEIFLTQLRAVLRASQGLDNLRLLLPMVSDPSEVSDARLLIDQAYRELTEDEGLEIVRPQVGAMVEVPSVACMIEVFAEQVDFFSVGTNDLTQYLLAVDRNNARVAPLYQGLHPAMLAVLERIVEGARRRGRPVGVCGELAGDPVAAVLLLGLGVDSLSMSVSSLPRIKWVLRSVERRQAASLWRKARGMASAREICASVSHLLSDLGLGGAIYPGS